MEIYMKKTVSIILLLSLLLSFAACAGTDTPQKDTPDDQDTTAADTTESPIVYEKDDLPDKLNFEQDVVILAPEGKNWEKELSVEDLSSEVVNDSIYNREIFVEDRLGVEITVDYAKDFDDRILTQMSSGDNTYQIYAGRTVFFSKNVFSDFFTDLYTLDYIDFDKPWWSENFTEAAEIKDHLYIATGSLALSVPRFLFALYYNKNLAETYSDSIPELADLYTIVESDNWTFDKLIELSGGIYRDLNGNTERDDEDLYGMLFNHGIAFDTIWSAFDINIFSHDEDGWFYLDVNLDRFYAILDKVIAFGHDTTGTMIDPGDDKALQTTMAEKFAGGSALFMSNKLHVAEEEILRNMQDEYGILPFPKYDEQQDGYYSFAHDQYLSFAIPIVNPDPDVAAATLEALSSYAYRDTVPAYLDLALKGKYMSDAKSREMIDLVINGFKVDSSWIYCETLGAFGSPFRGVIVEPTREYASTYATCQRNIDKLLKVWGKYFG